MNIKHTRTMKKKYQPIREYEVVSAGTTQGLTHKVKLLLEKGFVPIGNYQVVETHRQNRYAGSQHMDTLVEREYSQAMYKETKIGDLSDEEQVKYFSNYKEV